MDIYRNIFCTVVVRAQAIQCHSTCSAGPAFSRLDRLLPIGIRAEGGPALRSLTYASLCEIHSLFSRGPRCQQKSKWTVRYFNIFIYHHSFWNRNSGHWFRCVVWSFQ